MPDMKDHLLRQMAWSRANFGHGENGPGLLDHIRKELDEIEQSQGEASEWVDVVILAIDGLWRRLAYVGTLGDRHAAPYRRPEVTADMAISMIVGKQGRNELRDWPCRCQQEAGKSVEHIRGKDDGEH